jgi:hypothetical protein
MLASYKTDFLIFRQFSPNFSVSNSIFSLIIKIISHAHFYSNCCPYILSVRAEWRADERDPQTSLHLSLTLTPLLPTTSNKLLWEALKLCFYETLLPTHLIVSKDAYKYAAR